MLTQQLIAWGFHPVMSAEALLVIVVVFLLALAVASRKIR